MPTTTWSTMTPRQVETGARQSRRVRETERFTSERCPECQRGYVIHLSDNPEAVRDKCSRCTWNA